MAKMLNGIPVFKAVILNEDDGMFVCSLVDEPAIESNFMAFDKDKQLITLSIENEEQRLVLGAVMIPDKPLYRRFEDGRECYVVYEKDTITLMVEKFFADGFQRNTDINHNFEISEGVYLRQAFLKDTEKGISPKGFEDLPDNTLFFEYHIVNDDVWSKVKNGEVNGFSLAGDFHIMEFAKEEPKPNTADECIDILEQIINKIK